MGDFLKERNLADLHLHLGGATSSHWLWEMAHRQGIRLPEKDYFNFIKKVKIIKKVGYKKYLSYFDLTELIQSSVLAIEEAVHNVISTQYRMFKINLLEIRFNPMLRNREGERDLDKIILGAIFGLNRAILEYPVKAGLILMMDRRFDKEKNLIIVEKAVKFKNMGVVGVDLAGPINKKFRIKDLIEAIKLAKKHNLKITIHTGEITSVDEMWEVLEYLKPERIGHGIKAVNDKKMLEELRKRKVHLEICPTSNLLTKAVKSWQEMKKIIRALIDYQISFNINSDGPALLNTNVKKEYQKLFKKNILSRSEIEEIIKKTANRTFINS